MSTTQSPRSAKTKSSSPARTPRKPKGGGKAKAKAKSAKPVKVAKPVVVSASPTPAASPAAALQATDEQVAQRAYDIWVEKGRPYGQEDENWAQALAELRG